MTDPTSDPKGTVNVHLAELERAALDEAYKTHLAKLFAVWMSDPTARGNRAKAGAGKAREAYHDVLKAIEARERGEDR